MKLLARNLVLGLIIPLVGCGGDDSGNVNAAPPPPPITPSIAAISDLITTSEIGQTKHIPVYQYALPDDGQLLSIESVTVIENASTASNCSLPTINGLELIYEPSSIGACSYQYTVTDGDNTTQGRVISSVSQPNETLTKSSSSKLADIDKNATIGTEATYPIVNSANDTLAVVTVLGSGTAYANENNIVFKATGVGLSRVIYTLTNEQDATVKIGVINVSVSETGATNTPPSTPDTTAITSVGTTITITPSITDADSGDNPQLIGVVSPQGASVASTVEGDAVDDAYFTNKSFTFSARSAGLYTVYYTAHDHKGAYNTGKATVTVSGDVGIDARDASFYRSQTSLAYDFTIDLRSYVTAADPSKVEYLKAEFTATSVDKNIAHLTQTSDNKILTYRVPANQTGTIEIKYTAKNASGQDSGIIYISIGDGEAAKIVTLGTTPDVDYDVTVTATSTCNTPICDADKTTYQWYFADALISEEKSIEVPDGVDGEVLTLVATPYNTKGVRGISTSINYNYPLTPTITATIIKNNALADNVDKNIVKFNVKKFNKPLNGKVILANTDSDTVTLSSGSNITDYNGDVIFDLTNSVAETVNIEATYLSERAQGRVLFIPIGNSYCHQYPDIVDLNCLPYINLNGSGYDETDGLIFSAAPSQQYLNGILYPSFKYKTNTENGTYGHPGVYAMMDQNGQAADWCDYLSVSRFLSRDNWTLPTVHELNSKSSADSSPNDMSGLWQQVGIKDSKGMYGAEGWPTGGPYWSSTKRGGNFFNTSLSNGYTSSSFPNSGSTYVSCISKP